jgi:TRAP-type C4-dicarboxylate transport system substrate-binding protein
MKVTRRHALAMGAAAVAAPPRLALAQTPQVTLKLHHFLAPISNIHTKLLTPWARKVEDDSNKRIRIEIYPSMQLGGVPRDLFGQARDGVADIVWALPGNTPDRFPGIEVFDLPFVAHRRASVNARAAQEIYETRLRDEFKEVQMLCVCAHEGGVVHSTKPVRNQHDMRGLKLRSPTRLTGEALKALGANAIPMPIPQVADALIQKAIDGCVTPWEVVSVFKLQDIVKFHSEIAASPTLYTSTFLLTMNKTKYNSLPADLRKIIDDNTGQHFAALAGRMWDDQAILVADMVKTKGSTLIEIGPEETARWRKATELVIDSWLKGMKARGLDGAKLLADTRAAIMKYSAL